MKNISGERKFQLQLHFLMTILVSPILMDQLKDGINLILVSFLGITGDDVMLNETNEYFDFARDQVIITAKINRALGGPPGSNVGLRIDELLMSGGGVCGGRILGLHVAENDLKPIPYLNCNGTRKQKSFHYQYPPRAETTCTISSIRLYRMVNT